MSVEASTLEAMGLLDDLLNRYTPLLPREI